MWLHGALGACGLLRPVHLATNWGEGTPWGGTSHPRTGRAAALYEAPVPGASNPEPQKRHDVVLLTVAVRGGWQDETGQ